MRRFIYFIFVILALVPFGAGVFFSLNTSPALNIKWGVTFAHSQAQALSTDWRKSLTSLLDDLGVRHFRIPIYWDELENEDGKFDFTKWDWQLEQIAARHGTAILAVGQKLPRWPECRVPSWLSDLSEAEQDARVLRMLERVIEYYKENSVVSAWQVENEPIHKFGACEAAPLWRRGAPNKALLDAEIALVKKLDSSRKIIITDTAQFSFWLEASKRADIVGGSMYSIVHNRHLGFVHYFFPSWFYSAKAKFIDLLHPATRSMIAELQAEPWVLAERISDVSIEEQYETMSPAQFSKNINLAREAGFEEIYLWGSEWWYRLYAQGEYEIWDEAKKLFIAENLQN